MNYCENQKNTIDNDSINNNNNKSSSSDGTHILTVPRADYLLWCKRRMEGTHSCPVINNDSNAMPIIPTINTMFQTSTTPPLITTSLDKKKTTTTVTVTKGSPFGFALPPELLLEILSYLKESQSALYAVSLVCRQWMLCAAPLLYRHAKIMDTFRYATFILTLTRNKKTLFYGSLIHTLDLAAGNKLFGNNNNNNKQANTTHSTNPTGMTDQQMEEERDNAILLPTQEEEEEEEEDEQQDPRREVITRPESFIDNHGNSDVNDQSTTSTTITMTTARTTRANWTIQLVNPNNNENNTPVTTTTVTTTNNNINDNDIGWETLLQQRQQQEENNNNNNTTIESEYYEARDMKHGHLFVTTSSLLQIAKTCKNLTCLNMSLTTLFYDSMIAETGEYVSTLQHYAVQPGLTHILIPMSKVIETMGKECIHLQQVIMQRCDWVTAQVIWLWVTHCPKLIRLDARRSNKCSVKKLVFNLLEAEPNQYQQQLQREEMDPYSQDNHHHHQQQQQQDDMGMEMMMNDAPMLDHSEEEEEERIFFGNLRHQQPPRQQQQQQQQRRPYFHDRHNHHHPIQNQNNSNSTIQIPPVVIHDHELLNIQRYRDNLEALETTLTQRLQQRRGNINRRPSLNRRSTTTTTTTTRRTSATNNTSSSSSSSSDNNPIPEWRTLKQVVYDILVDAIERGADLPWFP